MKQVHLTLFSVVGPRLSTSLFQKKDLDPLKVLFYLIRMALSF